MTLSNEDTTNDEAGGDTSRLSAAENADKPSRTYLDDWVVLSDAPDQAVRYYWALRAFIFDKDGQYTYDVTDQELAKLMNRSVSSVERARKKAEEFKLIKVESSRQQVGFTKGIKHQRPMIRTIRVMFEPPSGYAGPVNVFTELRKIRADQTAPQFCGTESDQETVDNSPKDHGSSPEDKINNDQGQQGDSPGQIRSPTSAEPPIEHSFGSAEVTTASAHLPEHATSDQPKQAPQVPSSSPFPVVKNSSPLTEVDARDGDGGEGEPEEGKNPNPSDLAARFFRSVLDGLPATVTTNATQPSTEEKHRLVALLHEVWARDVGNDEVRRELTRDLGTVRHLGGAWIHRLEALHAQHNTTAPLLTAIEVCGQCEARPGDPVNARIVLLTSDDETVSSSMRTGANARDGWEWCPRCHPKGIRAELVEWRSERRNSGSSPAAG